MAEADNPQAGERGDEPPKEFVSPRDELKEPAAEAKPDEAEEPPAAKESETAEPAAGRLARFKHWFVAHKKLSIPLTIITLLVLLMLWPASRYPLASALGLKRDFTVQVSDASTHTPVSGADVASGNTTAISDASGKATLHKLPVGNASLKISKKYYQDGNLSTRVPLLKQKSAATISLVATGRQVKIKIVNLVGQKPLAGVDIAVAETKAKTDDQGMATVVVPAGQATQSATLSASGFNAQTVTVQVSDQAVKENDYQLVPVGKIYFLSNRSGKVDVMKSDLDGGNTTVVLAGTGHEDEGNTLLVASNDQKYLALLSRRTTDASPQLYVIPTNTDKALQIDSGNANFTISGWLGDYLIYSLSRNDQTFQPGKAKLKSYNAANGQLNALDQSAAVGDGSAYGYEYYVMTMLSGNSVVFAKNWTVAWNPGNSLSLTGKQNSLTIIAPDGSKRSQVAAFDDQTILPSYAVYKPDSLYIWQQVGVGNTFLSYTVGGTPKAASITPDQFYKSYPQFLSSPAGKQSLWSEVRDGKNTLFIGDTAGNGARQLDSGGDFTAYGWYTEQYLLVSKNSSELYVMNTAGGAPVKITNYLQAHGFGYGGQ